MDQGIAAVLGAGVGIVGTLGTAFLTYAGARHQTRDQGRIDHQRSVRNERMAAYEAFFESLTEHERRMSDTQAALSQDARQEGDTDGRWERSDERLELVDSGLDELRLRQIKVIIAGPAAVSDSLASLMHVLEEERRWLHTEAVVQRIKADGGEVAAADGTEDDGLEERRNLIDLRKQAVDELVARTSAVLEAAPS